MISDLHPGELYTFTIIAINNICPSQPSLPASVRTMEEGMLLCHVMSCDALCHTATMNLVLPVYL